MRPSKTLQLRLVHGCTVVAILCSLTLTAVASDQVLDWTMIMNDTIIAGGTSPLASTRNVALVSASVFDAVNGIEPQYQPLLVRPAAPRPASQRAAAIQAAYAMLVKLYPLQTVSLTASRDASMAKLTAFENAKAIQNGAAWAQTVADAIFAIRSSDGFSPPPPPFVGVLGITSATSAIGVWRPTPVGNATGAGPQFATMTPWVMQRPSQFRLPPPLALASAEYAADYNVVKTMGISMGSPRTADESEYVLFWAGNTPLYWDRIAAQVSAERHLTLSENAHLFALLNVAMADAGIACWDSKYRYVFWRPITAINNGDKDNNAATDANTAWVPWLDTFGGTPAHPEYPSGHSTVSGAAASILAAAFGDNTSFTLTSDVRPGTRSYASFSDTVAEIANARVFGGIHFRTSCVRGNLLGQSVADYVSKHAMRADGDDDRHEDRR
jgi:hypothetical protein